MNSARAKLGPRPCDGGTAHGQKRHAWPVPAGAAVHAPRVVTMRTARVVVQPTASRRWTEDCEVFR
jgi:hypothetical protein